MVCGHAPCWTENFPEKCNCPERKSVLVSDIGNTTSIQDWCHKIGDVHAILCKIKFSVLQKNNQDLKF